MADMTYNEAQNAINLIVSKNKAAMERNKIIEAVFAGASDILVKAEEAEGMLRITGPQIRQLVEDKQAALADFQSIESKLSERRADLDRLNRDIADGEKQRVDAIELANKNQADALDRLKAEYAQREQEIIQAIKPLSDQKCQLESEIEAAQKTLTETSQRVQDLKLRAQKAQAMFDN